MQDALVVRREVHLPAPPAAVFALLTDPEKILWGNVGAADRLDFTAIGPAVNLVSRLAGLCRPLEQLGEHMLRGIAAPCAVFTLADGRTESRHTCNSRPALSRP